MSLRLSPAAFLALGFLALSVAACGRAGPLEAPPQKTQQAVDVSDQDSDAMPSPLPTPQKQPKRPITIPNEPFFLDPIL